MPVVTDPYDDDDDDHPTLQRPAPTSSHVLRSPVTGMAPIDPLLPLAALDPLLPLPPLLDDTTNNDPVDNVPDYTDMETPKVPLDVAAILRLASQNIDEDDKR
jgi:hypothetical protein